ncbi:cytochrome c biogenesis protein ResB [Aquipuribacter hungaricus]|uniref:Cytochrome c biogenesis protein ResB n=1 Tax=Aquipuribacter hungaricus TaxID=545624 RepID=A0ABV7WPR8_9MICO
MTEVQDQLERSGVLEMPARPEGGGSAGWARWAWRSLTSMRSALVLLALLALAAVPGSLLPQRGVASDPNAVAGFFRENPTLAPWLDRLGLFEVYASPWFAAIYLLLLVSMTGCVLPRCARLWRATRADPPRAPGNLARLPGHRRADSTLAAVQVLRVTAEELRRRGFRVDIDGSTVRAEKGYLREVGNLLFHLSLLVLLFGIAIGALFGFEGRVVVAEGGGFSNTRSQYDEFSPGPFTDEARLTPFFLTLDTFTARFEQTGPQRGSARDFRADVTLTRRPGSPAEETTIAVNSPLDVRGTKLFLTGNGYAPRITVRDGQGREVASGPVVFLPLDGLFTSEGVVKAPDAQPEQLGFQGLFLPTAAFDPVTGPYSLSPDLLDPQLLLTAWTGDLGLSDGAPQSVYRLDTTDMEQLSEGGQPLTRALRPGETMTLPDGLGSVTFDGVARFVNLQIAYDPGKEVSLAAAIMLLVGLTMSLTIPRRRVWVRVHPTDACTTGVEVAAYSLTRQDPPTELLRQLLQVSGADTGSGSGPGTGSTARTEMPAWTATPVTKE